MVSLYEVGSPVAGEVFKLICEASVANGIQASPYLQWVNATERSVNGDITVGPSGVEGGATVLPLRFDPLRLSYAGEYVCQATLYSLVLEVPLSSTTTTIVIVNSK